MQNSCLPKNLPSSPLCVDRSAEKKLSNSSLGCENRCNDSVGVYDFTDSSNDSVCKPAPPPPVMLQRKRGRPPKQKNCHAQRKAKFQPVTVSSSRTFCRNQPKTKASNNCSSISQGPVQPVKKRGRGRPRKNTRAMLSSQKNCQKESQKVFNVKEGNSLHHERECSSLLVETEFPIRQEKVVEEKNHGTEEDCSQLHAPKVTDSRQDDRCVLLLHNTQPNPVEDESGDIPDAIQTPGWKDKSSEYQMMNDEVSCLTPPGSNECLSISGDDKLQIHKESFNQKSCQSPSNSTISYSSSSTQDFLFKDGASSPLSHPNMPNFYQDRTIIDKSSELPERTNSCSPCLPPENRKDLLCSNEYSQSMTEASQENAEYSSTQESDGLSQIRITKTISLSQDELLTNNTGCNSVETLGDNSIDNKNDIPVPACDDSSILQRRERKNIFQALRGGLNSPPSNLIRDNGETESSTQEDCHQEQMSLSDSDIPHLEAYGGCHYGHASNGSPHSGASDTLPILEKEAFHDTWPSNDNDDEDEFEFENPSGDNSEFEKPSESVSVEDSSKNWPTLSEFPQSNTDMNNAAEEIHQDLQKEDIGIQDDEDEFEFETPDEDMTIHPSEKSPMELSTSCHVTISDSSSRNEGIHDGQELLNEIKETEYDGGQNENSFPNLGLSPNPLGNSGALQGNSTSGNSTPMKIVEFQDCTASWSTTLGTASQATTLGIASQATTLGIVQIPAPADNSEEQSGNDTSIQEVCKTQGSLEKSLSVRNPGNITKNDITIISDQKNECRLPDIEMVQEDKEIDQKTNNIPDSLSTQDLGQDKMHSVLITLSPEMEKEEVNSGEMMDIPDSNVDQKLGERDEQCIKTSTAECNVDPIEDGIEEQSREMKASAEYDVGEKVEEQDEPSLKLNNTSECNLGPQIEEKDKSSSEMKDTAESIGESDGKLSEQMESSTECIVDPIIEGIAFGECIADKKFEEPDEQSSKKNCTEECSVNSKIEGLDEQMSDMKASVECIVAGKMVECKKDSPIEATDEKSREVNKLVECIVESSEESNTPQEIEKEHLQSNVPGDEMVQVPESAPADTNNANSSYQEQLPVSEAKGLPNNFSDGDLKCCTGKKKLITKFTLPYGNDITGHIDRATQDGNDCGGNLPSSVHIEESKSEKEKQDRDLQQMQDIRLHTRPTAEGQPCHHIDSDTEIISDIMEEILSNVSILQDQIVEHATSPVSEELQGTLESTEGVIEVVPTSHENRSNVVDLHEQKKKSLEVSSLGPDVNEISSVSSPKPDISLDTSQSIELQGASVTEKTLENANSLSGDFQNESDLHDLQLASASQCNIFADTLKESSLSSEQDPPSQEKVQDQSADHQLSFQLNLEEQKSTTLGHSQNDFTTEHLEEECPEETATKDQTILAETPCHDEGSKTPTDTAQVGNNLLNKPSKMSEELVNLIDASKESYQNYNIFLGASAGDETMDMLSIACEETVGGYEEDAMSTTSSGGATIAYPLSDGDNWGDPRESMVGNVVEVEEHQSSPVPDMTNPTTSQQRTDVKHTLTACKWTVTFRKVKKRKRSKERHHKKSRSKKHKKRHEPSKQKPTDTKQKCHLKTDLGADKEDIFDNETADTTTKLLERMEVEKDENPKLLLQKQTIDNESCDTRESRNHMDTEILEDEKDVIEQSEAPKSPEKLQMASISSPVFKSLRCPDTQTNQSIETNLKSVPLETNPLSGRIVPITTNEKVQEVSDLDKRPSSDDYKLCEPVIGGAEDVVTSVINDDIPRTPPSDQKLCNVPVTAVSPAPRVDISLPSVSLPNSQDVTLVEEIQPSNPPWQGMENVQRESTNMHSVQNTAGKGSRGAKTVHHITQDRATFFGTPRRDKSHFRPNITIGHSLSDNRFYLPHAKQSPHSLQQSALQMMHVRQSYRNPSGACKELKQHLLNKQRLAAPGSQNQFPQSHLPITNKEIVSNQNLYSAILPSERDLALNLLQRQSQIEVGKKHEGEANRHNSALPFLQVQTYQEQFQHFPPRTLPVDMNLHHSGALNSSNISTGVGHRDIDRLQPHGNRVATAGTFSPPCADDLQRNAPTLHLGQIHEKAEKSKVGYLPVDNQLGYAENIPVFTAKGPEKQLIAVYPDGYVPVPQTEISTHLNIQQSFQHARKLTPTLQHPHSNTGMSISQANTNRDEMLLLLRQLHGGNGTKSMRNFPVNLDQFGTRTSGISPLESPHIHENTRLNQVTALIQKPSQTSTALHQLPNYPQDSHLQNPLMMEHVSQRKNTVDAQRELFHPHSPQSSQGNFLAGAPSSFHNMTSSIPTPRMHSRTPTPVSTTTSTSDSFTNLSQLPSTELERTPLSRTSTPRSRCTPSSTPHMISESPLPGQTEILHSSSNNCSAIEDVPLDLTCKGRTRSNVDKNPTAPLDLSCKPILCDTESQEQNAVQVPYSVHEESRTQETLRRSHSEEPGSDIEVVDVQGGVEVNGDEPQDPVVLSCGSSDLSSSINSCIPVENRSAEVISHQDQNIPRQDVNIDLLRSKLGLPVNADNSSIPVNYQERSETVIDLSSVTKQCQSRDRNVYMDRAGGPHVFSDLLHHGLTSGGPGLKIAKTYNKFANPVTSTPSSIPLIDLTSIPKKMHVHDASVKSTLEVHHRKESRCSAKTPPNAQGQISYVPCQLRRTRSDDTEVRLSSGNLEYSSKVSPAVGLESNIPPDDSSIPPQSITRSSSTSNIVVSSADSNLQGQNSPLHSKFNVPMNVQSLSEMSQCPKKRFKRAHEASFLQSDVMIPSKIPAAKTDSDVAKPAHPSGPRKRGRPRGSKKTVMVSQVTPVMKQCKFCQFATTSRQEMKNHVYEKHFQKYSIKATKSNSVISIPDQLARLNDEVSASLPDGKGLSAKSFKIMPSLEHVRPRRNADVSKEISNMQRTGTDYCLHCDHYFPDTISLARHQRIHHNEKQNFGCRLCDFCSSAPGPLVYHINKTHSKELTGGSCPFRDCSRRFSTVKEVKDHLNDHWIEKQFACKICGVRYQVLSSLKAHLDRHSQNFPNICKDYHIYMTIWNVETASYEPFTDLLIKKSMETVGSIRA